MKNSELEFLKLEIDKKYNEKLKQLRDENFELNKILAHIIEKCKEKIIFCKSCSKNADINIDCVECDERGEAHFAQCILNNFLEIEEVNE